MENSNIRLWKFAKNPYMELLEFNENPSREYRITYRTLFVLCGYILRNYISFVWFEKVTNLGSLNK